MLQTLRRRWRALRGHVPVVTPAAARTDAASGVRYAIDRYSVFQGTLCVAGWCHLEGAALEAIDVVLPDGRTVPIPTLGLPSPDVAARLGPAARRARFSAAMPMAMPAAEVARATLRVRFRGRPPVIFADPGAPAGDPAHALTSRFSAMLRERTPGRLLEVGSRARSGIVRRDFAPEGWSYSGLDVMAGPNVDLVGDAHELSSLYPAGHFDAVMAFSVLEHLLMPWKFVIALNRVLKPGGIGLFTTHQCWPLHDEPWDFWRFSDRAWAGLLNPATGFEIIEARMGEPAFVVAARCQPATAFAETPARALASFVLFRKVAETALEWPVPLQAITRSRYPTTTADVSGG